MATFGQRINAKRTFTLESEGGKPITIHEGARGTVEDVKGQRVLVAWKIGRGWEFGWCDESVLLGER